MQWLGLMVLGCIVNKRHTRVQVAIFGGFLGRIATKSWEWLA